MSFAAEPNSQISGVRLMSFDLSFNFARMYMFSVIS